MRTGKIGAEKEIRSPGRWGGEGYETGKGEESRPLCVIT